MHERHPCLSTDENHLIKFITAQAGISQRLETILARARDHRLGQALELFAAQFKFKTKLRRQEWQGDGRFCLRR